MSLAVDPASQSNRRFYTCQGSPTAGGGHDVRVMAWRLNAAATAATRSRTLLTGLPATSGRHGGCRLLIAQQRRADRRHRRRRDRDQPAEPHLVGRQDPAPQPDHRRALADQPLHLAPATRNTRYVLTFGHRNVQGLAQRPDGTLWSVEHGTDRDDEVNRLARRRQLRLEPGARVRREHADDRPQPARHAARRQVELGLPHVATSGAAWVRGRKWGAYENTLAVAALKG